MAIKYFQHQKFSHYVDDERIAMFIEAESNEEACQIVNWYKKNIRPFGPGFGSTDEPYANRIWLYVNNIDELTLFKLTWM